MSRYRDDAPAHCVLNFQEEAERFLGPKFGPLMQREHRFKAAIRLHEATRDLLHAGLVDEAKLVWKLMRELAPERRGYWE